MNDISPIVRPLPAKTQPISPAKFAHFVLRTGQIDKMAEWYRTVLGARIVFRDERLCFLSYDDEHHRLALIQVPGLAPRDPEAAGTDHVAYSYRDLGELLATYRRLKEHAIVPHWPINHGVTTSMYYYDPDRNQVELLVDNFATAIEGQNYMRGRSATDKNPVGIDFDPDEMVKRIRNGLRVQELVDINA